MPVWLRTTLRLTALVSVVSGTSIVGLVVFRNVVDIELVRSSGDSLGSYMQTVGGIYAVLLAFVVVIVWGQFNDARGYVNREATTLADLYRLATGLPESSREVVQQGLRDYVDGVLTHEWEAMTKNDVATLESVGHRLDRVWSAIHTCDPQTACQSTIYSEVLSRFNELTDVRTNRLVAASTKIPVAMNVLLYTGAVIMELSVYLLPFDRFWLHACIAGAFAGAIAHILFLIYGLDNAFAGDYMVDKGPFIRARRSFDRAL